VKAFKKQELIYLLAILLFIKVKYGYLNIFKINK